MADTSTDTDTAILAEVLDAVIESAIKSHVSPISGVTPADVEAAPTMESLVETYGDEITAFLTTVGRAWRSATRIYTEDVTFPYEHFLHQDLVEAGLIRLYEREGQPCVKIGVVGAAALSKTAGAHKNWWGLSGKTLAAMGCSPVIVKSVPSSTNEA